LQIFLVPTSHWDREWYLPFERFRAWLVEALDDVLDLLERHEDYCFTLDGQSILLQDYLAVRPEMAERLRGHVASGRLTAGPWYVQPDEFLVSGESLVRNLQQGQALALRLGGTMRCGYLPDSFGHVADLPEVLWGFGIHSAVFARGAGDELCQMDEIFWWEAPSGRRVLAHLYPLGYGPAAGLSRDTALAANQLEQIKEALVPLCAAPSLLLPAGSDHSRPQPQILGAVELLNRGEDHWCLATPDAYFAALAPQLRAALPAHTGELRGARDAPLLSGTLSARAYLKLRNFHLEQLLGQYAEPAALFAQHAGLPSQHAMLSMAWATLLENHPHDSICGCSVDAVHQEMETRFAKVEQIATHVLDRSLQRLGQATGPAEPGALGKLLLLSCQGCSAPAQEEVSLQLSRAELARALDREDQLCFRADEVFHPLQVLSHDTCYEGVMEGAIEDLPKWLEQLADRHPVRDYSIRVEGEVLRIDVDEGPAAAGASGLNEEALGFFQDPRLRRVEIHLHRSLLKVAAAMHGTPARGYRRFPLLMQSPERVCLEGELNAGTDWLENEHLRITVDGHHGLQVQHKALGWTLQGLHQLQDVADRGDTYNFSPLPGDRPITAGIEECTLTERGPVRATLRLRHVLEIPAGLQQDRGARSAETVQQEIITDVSLWQGCPRLDFETRLHNLARDHRLRVAFPLPALSSDVDADTAFSVVRRPRQPPQGDGWPEQQVDAHPLRRFVDLSDGQQGVALLARGIAEYGCAGSGSDGGLSLTLIRAVGQLARDDIPERAGLAGPPYATPEAQCLREHCFSYALLLHPGDWRAGGVEAQARAFCSPPLLALCPDGEEAGSRGESLGPLPEGFWLTALLADPQGRIICRAINGSLEALPAPGGTMLDLAGEPLQHPGPVPPWGLVTLALGSVSDEDVG